MCNERFRCLFFVFSYAIASNHFQACTLVLSHFKRFHIKNFEQLCECIREIILRLFFLLFPFLASYFVNLTKRMWMQEANEQNKQVKNASSRYYVCLAHFRKSFISILVVHWFSHAFLNPNQLIAFSTILLVATTFFSWIY